MRPSMRCPCRWLTAHLTNGWRGERAVQVVKLLTAGGSDGDGQAHVACRRCWDAARCGRHRSAGSHRWAMSVTAGSRAALLQPHHLDRETARGYSIRESLAPIGGGEAIAGGGTGGHASAFKSIAAGARRLCANRRLELACGALLSRGGSRAFSLARPTALSHAWGLCRAALHASGKCRTHRCFVPKHRVSSYNQRGFLTFGSVIRAWAPRMMNDQLPMRLKREDKEPDFKPLTCPRGPGMAPAASAGQSVVVDGWQVKRWWGWWSPCWLLSSWYSLCDMVCRLWCPRCGVACCLVCARCGALWKSSKYWGSALFVWELAEAGADHSHVGGGAPCGGRI